MKNAISFSLSLKASVSHPQRGNGQSQSQIFFMLYPQCLPGRRAHKAIDRQAILLLEHTDSLLGLRTEVPIRNDAELCLQRLDRIAAVAIAEHDVRRRQRDDVLSAPEDGRASWRERGLKAVGLPEGAAA